MAGPKGFDMRLWEKINQWAEKTPSKPALGNMTYKDLRDAVSRCFGALPLVKGKRVGLFMDNSPLWAIYDIAVTLKGGTVVPVPGFFSVAQAGHVVSDAALDYIVIHRNGEGVKFRDFVNPCAVIHADRSLESNGEAPVSKVEALVSPFDTVKIIYTSGTTGKPKGVKISLRSVEAVVESLIERTNADCEDRHLSLLPLSTLIEAIAGLYAPLWVGGSVYYPARSGALCANISQETLSEAAPTTLNLVPVLLERLLDVFEKTGVPDSLRFVACGGAVLSRSLIERALSAGVPLYQGYGLSECATVVSLNCAEGNRRGSVGRPLKHVKVAISDDREIIVEGEFLMEGYLHGKAGVRSWKTGDTGYFDEDGFLYVTGRKDNVFSTSFGRNVEAEWVESELLSIKAVRQAVVFGEGKPYVSALIVPEEKWLAETAKRFSVEGNRDILAKDPVITGAFEAEIKEAMSHLPDYAAVKRFALVASPFSADNGLASRDGRLKRKEILSEFSGLLKDLYDLPEGNETREINDAKGDVYAQDC
ncbi:MAG TPA: AMP-binding protein [Thermodesulfobacteriota bacterium]|nr:AMP-binding protein [Thermodesulfobacteriota bacterium]